MNYHTKQLVTDNRYGLGVSVPDVVEVDEARMSVVIPFADGNNRDGVGDLLEIGGIRTERHQSNPIVLYDHGKEVKLPIALSEDPVSHAYTVQLDPISKIGRGQAFFYQGTGISQTDKSQEYEHAVFCQQLFHLICKRVIRAGSIGYQVVRAVDLSPDYEKGTPKGLHLLVTLMLEYSSVVLPANMDTVSKGFDPIREILCQNGVCGKKLSPYLVKSLKPFMQPVKAQLGYEGKAGMRKQDRTGSTDARVLVKAPPWHARVTVNGKPGLVEDPGFTLSTIIFDDGTTAKVPHSDVVMTGKSLGTKAVPQQSNVDPSKIQAEDKVVARTNITWTNPASGKTELFARSGERLRVVAVDSIGRISAQRTSDGKIAEFSSAEVRKGKSMEARTKAGPKGNSAPVPPHVISAGDGFYVKWRNSYSKQQEKGPFKTKEEAQKVADEMARMGHGKGFETKAGVSAVWISTDGSSKVTVENGIVTQSDFPQYCPIGQKPNLDFLKRAGFRKDKNPRQQDVWGRDIKSLPDIRLKHRKVKGFVRRHRKSSPGTSFVYVSTKDMDRLKQECENKGVKAQWTGTHSKGVEKFKMVGDDNVIDNLARQYGKAVGSRGSKSMGIKAAPGPGPKLINDWTQWARQHNIDLHRPGGGGVTHDNVMEFIVRSYGSERDTFLTLCRMIGIGGGQRAAQFWDDNRQRYGVKTMTKELRRKVKSAPDQFADDADIVDPTEDEMMDTTDTKDLEQEEPNDEPYGAQVLRRLHEDHSILMKDYDEMLGPLENEHVKKILSKKLEGIEGDLTEYEGAWGKHYDHLPGLDGAMDNKDLTEDEADDIGDEIDDVQDDLADETADTQNKDIEDSDALQADSSPEEEVSDEDSIEGMETKRLRLKQTKVLRRKYGKGHLCNKCRGTKACTVEQKSDGWYVIKDGKQFAGPYSNEGAAIRDKREIEKETPANMKDFTGGEEDEIEGELDQVQDDLQSETADTEKALEPHEEEKVHEAKSFLKDLGNEQNFGDEHRMKSYHYHKALEPIGMNADAMGSMGGMSLDEEDMEDKRKGYKTYHVMQLVGKNWVEQGKSEDFGDAFSFAKTLTGTKKIVDDSNGKEYPIKSPDSQRTGMKDMEDVPVDATPEGGSPDDIPMDMESKGMGCRKAIGEASTFFKELSQERAFGDTHRQKAMTHCKALDDAMMTSDPMDEATAEVNVDEPGEMGTMSFDEEEKEEKGVTYGGLMNKIKETLDRAGMSDSKVRLANDDRNGIEITTSIQYKETVGNALRSAGYKVTESGGKFTVDIRSIKSFCHTKMYPGRKYLVKITGGEHSGKQGDVVAAEHMTMAKVHLTGGNTVMIPSAQCTPIKSLGTVKRKVQPTATVLKKSFDNTNQRTAQLNKRIEALLGNN